jgi:NAD(P)H dehydrogenase (quinone)
LIEILGPTYYSSSDVAAALEKALDRPVTGVAVPRETWVDNLAQHGMPADLWQSIALPPAPSS